MELTELKIYMESYNSFASSFAEKITFKRSCKLKTLDYKTVMSKPVCKFVCN